MFLVTAVLHQLDQKIIYPHYDFKHLTEKYFEIGMKLNDFSIQLVKYWRRSLARTGPYSTKKPNLCCTSYAEIPGAESCDRMRMRCRTTLESPEHLICLTSSSAQKVPLPVAQSEKSDDIQIQYFTKNLHSSFSHHSFTSDTPLLA